MKRTQAQVLALILLILACSLAGTSHAGIWVGAWDQNGNTLSNAGHASHPYNGQNCSVDPVWVTTGGAATGMSWNGCPTCWYIIPPIGAFGIPGSYGYVNWPKKVCGERFVFRQMTAAQGELSYLMNENWYTSWWNSNYWMPGNYHSYYWDLFNYNHIEIDAVYDRMARVQTNYYRYGAAGGSLPVSSTVWKRIGDLQYYPLYIRESTNDFYVDLQHHGLDWSAQPLSQIQANGGPYGYTQEEYNYAASAQVNNLLDHYYAYGVKFTLTNDLPSPIGVPSTRYGHSTTLLPNGKILNLGGASAGSSNANIINTILDLSTDALDMNVSTPNYIMFHTAVLLPNGKVMVAGGGANSGNSTNLNRLYNAATNSWSIAAPMSAARRVHTATLLPNGKVLVAGGIDSAALKSAEIYDPATNSWSAAADMPAERYGAAAELLPNGKVLVAGGANTAGNHMNTAFIYDPAAGPTGSWSSAANMSVARYAPTMATLTLYSGGTATTTALVAGGSTLRSIENYNVGSNTWSTHSQQMDTGRYHAAALQLPDGKVLVTGGLSAYDVNAAQSSSELIEMTAVDIYNRNSWNTQLVPAYTPAAPQTALFTGTKFIPMSQTTLATSQLITATRESNARFINTGWDQGTGRTPQTGTSNSVTFSGSTADSSLRWKYAKQYVTKITVNNTGMPDEIKTLFDAQYRVYNYNNPTSIWVANPVLNSTMSYWTTANTNTIVVPETITRIYNSVQENWVLEAPVLPPWATMVYNDVNREWHIVQARQFGSFEYNFVYTKRLNVDVRTSGVADEHKTMVQTLPGFSPLPDGLMATNRLNERASLSAPNVIYADDAGKINQFRYVLTGWTGEGSIANGNPSSGMISTATPTITSNSAITWNYKKQMRVTVTTRGESTQLAVYDLTGNTAGGSTVVSNITTTGLSAGMLVFGNGISSGTTVSTVNSAGNTVTLSSASMHTITAAALTFATDPAAASADPRECTTSAAVCAADAGAAKSGVRFYDFDLTAATPPQVSQISLTAKEIFTELVSSVTTTRSLTQVLYSGGGPGMVNVPQTIGGRKVFSVFNLSQPLTIEWRYDQAKAFPVGMPIEPPDGLPVDLTVKPSITINTPTLPGDTQDSAFVWAFDNASAINPEVNHRWKYFPIHPVNTFTINWPLVGGGTVPETGTTIWLPKQKHIARVPANLQPRTDAASNTFNSISYTTNAAEATLAVFSANTAGTSVLRFNTPRKQPFVNQSGTAFIVVETEELRPEQLSEAAVPWNIGARIFDARHIDPENLIVPSRNKTGYLYFEGGVYDGAGPDKAYDRTTRSGAIIPVNESSPNDVNPLVVVWYSRGQGDIGWPTTPVQYNAVWPANPSKIFIGMADGCTSAGIPVSPTAKPRAMVYNQPVSTQIGFNPNEEHAVITGDTLYALRDDLNLINNTYLSKPYVLLKYYDVNAQEWTMDVYQVSRPSSFTCTADAGTPIVPPLPASFQVPPVSDIKKNTNGSEVGGEWYLRDHKRGSWAKAANWKAGDAIIDADKSRFVMHWYYYMRADFYWPFTGALAKKEGDVVPFLNNGARPGNSYVDGDKPIDVTYVTKWPADSPVLPVGDRLTVARDGLPDLYNFMSAEVIFDDNVYKGKGPLAKLYAPERYLYVPLAAVPAAITTEIGQGGVLIFPELPFALQARLFYDKDNKRLGFKGAWISSEGETPWLLPNLMTADEKKALQDVNADSAWKAAVASLYELTRNPNGVVYLHDVLGPIPPNFWVFNFYPDYWQSLWTSLGYWQDQWGIPLGLELRNGKVVSARSAVGEKNALSAGTAKGEGYVVIAENNHDDLGDAPVLLHVIRVAKDPVYKGVIKAIKSKNIFDEKLTLHYTGDFGGEPEKFNFEWYYQPVSGSMPSLPQPGAAVGAWQKYMTAGNPTGAGLAAITIQGASPLTMSDNWFAARYYYKNAWPAVAVPSNPANPATPHDDQNNWSAWSGANFYEPMLALGWIKRVVDGLNPLEARVTDFRNSATNTTVSMLSQFGTRYEGAIAMNSDADNLNSLGLISAYETVLNRGREFSIDAMPPQNYGPTNDSLLNISSRLATFYLALGNEAYADAVDPTIGFSTKSAEYGNMAASVFAFQNQMDSLLEEELALMRGRDDTATTTRNAPYYNRLIWNFTQGEGEVAYAQNYNVTDQDGTGVINAGDARIMYPQGHGDAWGHYLQSIKYYYKLLGHPFFSWEPRVEFVLVAGNPIMVDYLDERKFASIAAARAKAGAEILDLTYRKFYTDDPAGQWQGYKDTYTDRAWGVDEWARRAGQGAFFDWVTANAILPDSTPAAAHDRTRYVTGINGVLAAETIPGADIQQIDRSKVPELKSIASQFHAIQAKMGDVDSGVNPLGLVKGVVPFDIDPTQVDAGQTHFEQVYERAEKALANAIVTYDYANGFTQRLRQNQDTLEEFKKNLNDQERDYKNRLIEIFGYPYADDIGAGKTYPDGYDGPDIFHYNYVDRTELTGEKSTDTFKTYTSTFTLPPTFWNLGGLGDLGLGETTHTVTYNVDGEHKWLAKPATWKTTRRAPGRIQQALSDLIVAEASHNKAIAEYDNMVAGIEDAKNNLQVRYNVLADQIALRNTNEGLQIALDTAIVAIHTAGIVAKRISAIYAGTADGIVEALPKIVGTAFDASSPARGTIKTVNSTIVNLLNVAGDVADGLEFAANTTKGRLQAGMDLKLVKSDANYEIYQMIQELQNMVSDVDLKLLEMYSLQETLQQAVGNYQAALAEGLRLYDERAEKRAQSAADVQEYRYQDLGFRVFRNDAIQKYRAQYDLAAKYVYLAATAYDYETNLLGTASGAGRKFLSDIARQRSLGVVSNGTPLAGFPGLADVMARLSQNFAVYKTQLGFNNPQTETTPFSLRTELFRIRADEASDSNWKDVLKDHKVDDLWKIPEFKRYCRPFAPESAGPQPGIVITFPTMVTYGKNFFGWPLSGGDSAYSSSNFSTRVRSVGLWFQNYDNAGLSSTPRVYLVPTGADVLRSPTGDGFALREWQVRDQKLPVPFPIGDSDLNDPSFIPVNDSLSDDLSGMRRVSDFRAYPYSGAFDPGQATTDSRLIGRSVWNTQWMMIIPGSTLLFNKDVGLNTFINSVDDIKMFFQTYSYSGN